jgi:hypothetical protein
MTDMALRFDTLKVVERLEQGGFTHEQAKAQTEVLAAVVNTDVINAATKDDLNTAQKDLHREIKAVEHKLEQFQISAEGNFKLLRWMMGFMLAMMSGILYKLILVH